MTNKNEFFLKTTNGKQIFTRTWIPESNLKAVIILVHGLGEHNGRYEYVSNFFNQNQIAFFSMDLSGHGKTEGLRGHADSFDEFSQEINSMMNYTKELYPDTPIFLYGHSMGGTIALYHVLSKKPDIRGLIVTSPLIEPGTPVPPVKMMAAKVFNKLFPKLILENGLDVNNLSRDPMIIKDYVNDPLVHSKLSARLGMQIVEKAEWEMAHAKDLSVPTLLLQGGKDHLVNPERTRDFAEKAPKNMMKFVYFPDHLHELHNEPDRDQTLKIILDWIEKRL